MNLSEVRNIVVKESGRYDLSASELNNFINRAVRWLDRKSEHFRSIAREFFVVNEGDYFVQMSECRVVSSVLIGDGDGMDELTRVEFKDLKLRYGAIPESLDTGKPKYYAPAYLRYHEIHDGITGYLDVMTDWKTYNGIVFMPPADGQYHLEVWGKFFSKELSDDNDENFWTVNEPMLLVKATLREIEVFHRNTQGVNDWNADIMHDLYLMECDFIEHDVGYIDQIEG